MVRKTDDSGPLLGALLRGAHQAMVAAIAQRLAELGHDAALAQYGAVARTLWEHPDGVHATELAGMARITKQSMAPIVQQLERDGYVERVDDPIDRRAKLVRYTARGHELGRATREVVRRIEGEWAKRLGKERLVELRATLAELLSTLEIEV